MIEGAFYDTQLRVLLISPSCSTVIFLSSSAFIDLQSQK